MRRGVGSMEEERLTWKSLFRLCVLLRVKPCMESVFPQKHGSESLCPEGRAPWTSGDELLREAARTKCRDLKIRRGEGGGWGLRRPVADGKFLTAGTRQGCEG